MVVAPQETYEEAQRLAEAIERLAYNIWWTWSPDAQALFKILSEEAWVKSGHNAVAVVQSLSRQELVATLFSNYVRTRAREVVEEFEDYLNERNTWGAIHCAPLHKAPVAYFCAEFGLHESLPTYSGGLGILSGDHIKSASDLGLPLIGISLFYRHGYFHQRINHDGWQEEVYPPMEPGQLPVELVTGAHGEPIVCRLTIAHTEVAFHAWRINVGRCVLYLLDTNRPENDFPWREITSRVYGGDQTTRVSQELVLGVGGLRLLRTLGIHPSVYHLNEGHSSFLLLELMAEQIAAGKTLKQARALTRAKAVFTTHTPVAAGHDRFSRDLLDHLMHHWPAKMGLDMEGFMDLGRERKGEAEDPFCMTVLALENTRAANGVSELHGQVSREMWRKLFGKVGSDEVPIGHITNGVHVLGWMNSITYSFWDDSLGVAWLRHLMKMDFWEKVTEPAQVSDEAIWGLRRRLKRQMIEYLRECHHQQTQRAGLPHPGHEHPILDPDALTIGFARRFATYKRADLLFTDADRAARLLNEAQRPVQFVFAGKAHPRDDDGKGLIQKICHLSREPRFLGKVVFIENYDVQLARYLVSGCDVWMNNPLRPLEASGTSGQKAPVHGCLNLSILDGWWREGYDGTNGFAIGEDADDPETDPEKRDRKDAENLYRALENEVIPEFYDRDALNVPRAWIGRIRRAMATLIPRFNTDRMVAEYVNRLYLDQD